MQYLIVFLEGVITFVSPCLLPMLPIYISYFAAGENSKSKTFTNALGFITGFTIVFMILGLFASTVGKLFIQYSTAVNIIAGAIVILFGLSFLGVIKLNFFSKRINVDTNNLTFAKSVIFGSVFSISWTPCVGAFLGSALMLAAQSNSWVTGLLMLLLYSLGLGIPFLLSALIIDKLKSTLEVIKKHYTLINNISGLFLILVGIVMMTGTLGRLLSIISF